MTLWKRGISSYQKDYIPISKLGIDHIKVFEAYLGGGRAPIFNMWEILLFSKSSPCGGEMEGVIHLYPICFVVYANLFFSTLRIIFASFSMPPFTMTSWSFRVSYMNEGKGGTFEKIISFINFSRSSASMNYRF